MKTYDIPLLIRGKIVTDHMVAFEGRRGELTFRAPEVSRFADRLPLSDPGRMANLYDLSFDEVVQFLDELGKRLKLGANSYMQEAYELSCITSGLTREILYHSYDEMIPKLLSADSVREVAEERIGISALEGWTRHRLTGGRIAYTRPLGARCIHVTAGNSPGVAAITTLWNGITRGDAVVKSPSNDPLTSLAIGRTMIDMAPDHPLTEHYSVAYWKGGDTAVESRLYSPEHFEKIVAWGGFASMKHITRYLQPGLELIAMDPKLSGTIIGKEAFESDETMRKVAGLIALDFGGANQEGCVNARVISLQSGTDAEGLASLNKLAEYTYEALQQLPLEVSAPHPAFSPELRQEIAGIRKSPFYRVVGNEGNRGAVIVSQIPEPVEFAALLACRVANFVPFDDIEEALQLITIHTQTIGVYPDSLKRRYRERLAFLGGQRIVSLGGHLSFSHSLPHDAMEPLRRLCRWINDEDLPEVSR
jgi:Acyl-CoA reductase (LuxC)